VKNYGLSYRMECEGKDDVNEMECHFYRENLFSVIKIDYLERLLLYNMYNSNDVDDFFRLLLITFVVEDGRQPTFCLVQIHVLAFGVAFHLVLADLTNGKVFRLRVSEDQSGHRCCRHHTQ
jgi:hypothetical protein